MEKYYILNDARSGILSLTVISATEADIGQYECEVTTTHTPKNSKAASSVNDGSVFCSSGTSLAASGAKPGFVLLTYRQLTWRTNTCRTYLLKVGEPGLLKVNILPTGWSPADTLGCTFQVQLCLREDEAHAINDLTSDHPSSSHQTTSLHSKVQQTASVPTLNHSHLSILSR